MNTTQLKRFAAEARNKLREGVKGRLIRLGFDLKTGEVPENLRPVAIENAGVWRGKAVSNNFMYNWNELYNHVKQIGIKQMIEEGAYTWFNRLVAIRILAKNNLCDAVLQYVDSARTPRIVDEARTGRIPPMSDEQRQHLDELLEDDRLVTEQFAVLINAWVNNNPIISTCFDADSKHFMELLLPDDIRNEGGFLDMLNSADFISDEDYRSPELIGWLYQFYISERKDEVFAKKGKYDADEIAPATQIFTPNWIVKYMVQNTVGRIYLDSLPESSKNEILNTKYFNWKYLVEPSDSEKDQILNTKHEIPLELDQLKVADLACGSGHILNECFDLLYELYIHEGYSRREAITNIFEHNLTGVDIDLRAKQLATFALLLKACQRDSSFADAHCLPHVYDMPKVNRYTYLDLDGHFCTYYREKLQDVLDGSVNGDEIKEAFILMENADSLGSIMKFDISPATRKFLAKAVKVYKEGEQFPTFTPLIHGFQIILAITEKYDAIVMNPPYMGGGKFPDNLTAYARREYPDSKADLFAIFMEHSMNILKEGGRLGVVTMEAWMFLSSFEGFRQKLLSNYFINSLSHFGWHVMGIAFGTVSCVIEKNFSNNRKGVYSYLTINDIDKNKNVPFLFPIRDNGRYSEISQENFTKIPGNILGYWISTNLLASFDNYPISEFGISDGQNITGDNNKYLRYFWEISRLKSGRGNKWVPMAKGGDFRKWYGNIIEVVNWSPQAREEYRTNPVARIQSEYLWYKKGITWNLVSSHGTGFRVLTDDALFNKAAPTIVIKEEKLGLLPYILGFLNTKITSELLSLMNPTINTNIAEVFSLPLTIDDNHYKAIDDLTNTCINISRNDWNNHETSLDFQENEIVGLNSDDKYIALVNGIYEGTGLMVDLAAPQLDSLEWRTDLIKAKWANKFTRLHANEEELNRRFIEIYGLQDELTPDVPLNEVTILQQGEISIWKEGDPIPREVKNGNVEFSPIVWHDDVLVKQLISYAVGCMMGRYRLDRPGLVVAHPDATAEEIAPYPIPNTKYQTPNTPNAPNTKYQTPNTVEDRFDIDDDAIIPLMLADCGFYDNATQRMSDFVRQVFGAETQTENLNYIERCLGKSIEQYFIKDFWKDHKKMYQNRPIYWLFSSKKGAFQVITYMHRMTPYTVERIRAKYLLPYIETLGSRIAELQSREDELSTAERKLLDSLQKQLEECREYHDRLAVVAERAIGFDLDDGVLHNYALYGDILAKLK